MPARPSDSGFPAALFGLEGELVSLRISVEPRMLEELLESLCSLEFPVNPQLYHRTGEVTVEFPAYSSRVEEVRKALRRDGFDPGSLESYRVLTSAGGA